jgi:hypothetical protein
MEVIDGSIIDLIEKELIKTGRNQTIPWTFVHKVPKRRSLSEASCEILH